MVQRLIVKEGVRKRLVGAPRGKCVDRNQCERAVPIRRLAATRVSFRGLEKQKKGEDERHILNEGCEFFRRGISVHR